MTIFIDDTKWKKSATGRTSYSHMVSDVSLSELHEFATKNGIKRHFFHNANVKHYDIKNEEIQRVLNAGAFLVSSRELIKLGKYAV